MTNLFASHQPAAPSAPAVTLRPYQQAAIDAIYSWFDDHGGNPLIVAPTGSGKSVILTAFIHSVLAQWPSERILVLTHVRELIAQNHAAMLRMWPDAPAGICSAGIGRREWDAPILFAGIQTVHSKAAQVGWADLVIVDEAHLIPTKGFGMYRRFLSDLQSMNSKLKVIGLTATPFRTDSGRLDRGPDRMFHGIAYDCDLVQLIADGYLSEITSRGSAASIDTSGVHKKLGEFVAKELEQAAMRDGLVSRAVAEILARAEGRNSLLLFCTGIEHSEAVRDELRRNGIDCECVFGETPKEERDDILARFKAGKLRAISNFGVLTTGFDAPNIDLIALLRPTCSPGLYVQMVGRGMRIATSKKDCLVLDFGGNVLRHGPINCVQPVDEGDEDAEPKEPPLRECPQCHLFVLISLRACPECGFDFAVLDDEKPPHEEKPDESVDIVRRGNAFETWPVQRVVYREHNKPGKPPSLRVDYECGWHRTVSEWVCFEHEGYAQLKARRWWKEHGGRDPVPETVDMARVRIDLGGELRPVISVTVDNRGDYPKLLGVRQGENEAGLNEESMPHVQMSDEDLPF